MRRALKLVLLVVCGGSRVAAAETTGADASCGSGRPWVRFERPSAGRAPGFQEIVRHVRAELVLRDIDVCLEGGKTPPIASVRITPRSDDAVEVVVDVRDAITHKQVSRVLDLRSLPADARPLAIAIGTDELLRASWVEIAIKPEKSRPPPPQVDAVVERDLTPVPRGEVSPVAVFESYGGGQKFIGIDVRGGFRPLPPLSLTARFGMRQGAATTAPNGTIRTSAVVAGAGASFDVAPPRGALGAAVFARCDAVLVSFVSEPDPGARAHPGQGTALTLAGGAAGWLAFSGSLRLVAEVSAGTVLRPVRAVDTGTEATAVAGFELGLGAGLAYVF